MHDRPETERENPASARLDELPTLDLVRVMNDEDRTVAPAVAREGEAIARAIDAIALRLTRGGRLIYLGAGTSGRLGVLDASECPPTFGSPPEQVVGLIAGGEAALVRAREGAEDSREGGVADVVSVALSANDVLVGISASGTTPYVLAAVGHARKLGAFTIGLSCNRGSPLSKAAELAITPVPGPEVVTGSTRLKAGTATKLVLNMLSTGAMVRLGRVAGNRMVDLKPGSAKLRERAARIVAELGGVDAAAARELLLRHGSVRAAVAAARAGGGAAVTSPAPQAGNGCVAGLDGGGTRTRAALAETAGGAPRGEAETGPCNLATDLACALASIEEALASARAGAAVREGPFDAICIAAAGSGDASLRERARAELLAKGVARRIAIVPDAAAVLAAANDDACGLALIAGTGSLAFGRTRDGRCARAGGYGSLLGDPGSGHLLGASALRAAALVADGHRGSERLKDEVFRAAGLDGSRDRARDLARVTSAWRPEQIAALAPLVVRAAADGDGAAQRMVQGAASQLAELAGLVLKRLSGGAAPDLDAFPLVLAGGLFTGFPAFAQLVGEALAASGARLEMTKVKRPELGALVLARQLAAGHLDEASWYPS
jgi:N-acetylmuramic acid 6-phosphate etherase